MQMTPRRKPATNEKRHGSLLVLAVLALIIGAVSGLVGALFLLMLERADKFRDSRHRLGAFESLPRLFGSSASLAPPGRA